MIIENDGGNDYKIMYMGKESMEMTGLLPGVLDVTPAASAWLNPTMDDDSSQDSDDLDDAALVELLGLSPLIPLLQCVNWLGLRFVLWTVVKQNKEAWSR